MAQSGMATTLTFGTAGIRAPLGEGPDRINTKTVSTVVLALSDYLIECFEDAHERGVCIGFDGRTQSRELATVAAEMLLGHGFRIHRFEDVIPTPLLAYCTRTLDAVAGVMITASHNPPGDNGIKVYFRGGAQVLAPHDQAIAQRMASLTDEETRPRMTVQAGHLRGRVHTLGAADVQTYLQALDGLLTGNGQTKDLHIAYTAMCGVGTATTLALLARHPVRHLSTVSEQSLPLHDFGGLSSPNPEHTAALAKLQTLMEESGAELGFAHDPDADRLAVITRDTQGAQRVLSGDETGCLLAEWLLSRAPEPKRALLLSTVVSSELIEHIAREHGATFAQTLTGFKWIASRARQLEREGGLHFLFGYEEAIGYAFGELGDDKDGIAAMGVMLELAASLKSEGRSLCDELARLAQRHGLFVSRQLTFAAPGAEGKARLDATMASLRGLNVDAALGAGATLRDYATEAVPANLLVIRQRDRRICVRPSGTEPKLKVYLHARIHRRDDETPAAHALRAQGELDELEALSRAWVTL